MTLRRCDSLPTKLRELPTGATRPLNKIPDSHTDPHIDDNAVRNEVIAAWRSLHTDVKNIKNGFTSTNGPSPHGNDKRSITHFSPALRNNRETQKKITYGNRHVAVEMPDDDRCSSFPLTGGQNVPERKPKSLRRRTLLERLLSWRTPECDCQTECPPSCRRTPKPRPEEVLCTCGVAKANFTNNRSKYAERGRSKSVGYEAAREVTQFRRLVLC